MCKCVPYVYVSMNVVYKQHIDVLRLELSKTFEPHVSYVVYTNIICVWIYSNIICVCMSDNMSVNVYECVQSSYVNVYNHHKDAIHKPSHICLSHSILCAAFFWLKKFHCSPLLSTAALFVVFQNSTPPFIHPNPHLKVPSTFQYSTFDKPLW